jgi:hypothetical protein
MTIVPVRSLDRPTGLRLGEHIYVGPISDSICPDGLPQKYEWQT